MHVDVGEVLNIIDKILQGNEWIHAHFEGNL